MTGLSFVVYAIFVTRCSNTKLKADVELAYQKGQEFADNSSTIADGLIITRMVIMAKA
jgi:hypothetical protein